MKSWKRKLYLLTALVVAFSVSACGTGNANKTTESSTKPIESSANPVETSTNPVETSTNPISETETEQAVSSSMPESNEKETEQEKAQSEPSKEQEESGETPTSSQAAEEKENSGKLVLQEENGVLTCLDTESSPFADCALRTTVDPAAGTITFVKATKDGKDTKEYYRFTPAEHMLEQYYYVSMMGTGFYYYFDTDLREMVRLEDKDHKDTTQSAKDNGRFEKPAKQIKEDAASLEEYFSKSFGMTLKEAVQK